MDYHETVFMGWLCGKEGKLRMARHGCLLLLPLLLLLMMMMMTMLLFFIPLPVVVVLS